MPKRSAYVEYLLELLEPFGEMEAKSMFGGYGLYHEGLMFALVAYDTIYFKVDDDSKPEFDQLGLEPFIYEKNGKKMAMSYHVPPADALDRAEELSEWAKKGHDAALRAAAKKAKRKPRKKAS